MFRVVPRGEKYLIFCNDLLLCVLNVSKRVVLIVLCFTFIRFLVSKFSKISLCLKLFLLQPRDPPFSSCTPSFCREIKHSSGVERGREHSSE
jgi:hypothetical protein